MEPSSNTLLVFTNGSSILLRPGFVRAMAHSARFQIFVIFCILFFVFTRPYELQVHLDRWQAILIIVAMGSMVFAMYLGAFAFLIRFGARLRIRRFYTIWLVILTSFSASFLGQKSLVIFGEPPLSMAYTLLVWGFHFSVFAGMEVLFGIFVLPDLAASLAGWRPAEAPLSTLAGKARGLLAVSPPPQEAPAAAPEIEPPSPPPSPAPLPASAPTPAEISVILISDRRFPARAIRWVASQEHYISISLFEGETHFLRGRISDFLGQVPEDLGYCIHRSHWVSWAGVERVVILKDSTSVILTDKTELPVARGRRSDFIARWNRRAKGAAPS